MTAAWIAIGALAVLAIAEAVAIVALAREVGLLSVRLPPTPALESGDGPAVGAKLPTATAWQIGSGRRTAIDGAADRPRVLVLLSTSCSACHVVLQDLQAIQADWPDHDFVPVVSGSEDEVLAMSRECRYAGAVYRDDGETMRALQVAVTPTAVVLDEGGTVTAKGVVNSRDMVGSLLTGHIRVNHHLVDDARRRIAVSEGGSA